MSLVVKVGAAQSGGTDVTLISAGLSAGGKSSFVAPGSSQLEPRLIDFFVTKPTTTSTNPGVARAGMKIAFAARATEEGCCTVNAGTVIADISIRWPLNQDVELVDGVLNYLQGLVFTDAFRNSIVQGILPQ